MEELLQAVTKSYGLIGIFMVSPMVATVYLWNDNKRLNRRLVDQANEFSKRIEDVGTRVVDAQTMRVRDAQGITDKLVNVIVENTSHTKEMNTAIDRLGDMLSQAIVSMHTANATDLRRVK